MELSPRQREILEFVNTHVDEQGYPPTVREIGQAVGLTSPSTVHAHLARLESSGLIRRDPTKPRALEVIEGGRSRERAPVAVGAPHSNVLPLLGDVAAGTAIKALPCGPGASLAGTYCSSWLPSASSTWTRV